MTPLTAILTPGLHKVELVTQGERRSIPVSITAGGHVSQFIELPKSPAGVGQLQIQTEPAGANVTVDGQLVGTSPLTRDSLAPGVHRITLANDLGSIERDVTIEAGITSSLVVPLQSTEGSLPSGWISVRTPVDVQLYENRQLLGSSRTSRIMVPAGRHELEIVNERLGLRLARTVTVTAGQATPLKLELPKGALSINALPWAEVWIDGDRIGETPIGNMSVPIGTHEVLFRHPELGEEVHRTTVTLNAPTRLSVDLRKK
jgi:hypothetical protein